MKAGAPGNQFEWHEAYRDQVKNMYRSSYSDMSHGRECYVKSDFPSGYGGHVPSIRHDVLFRNTSFDRSVALMRQDPSRDALPSFTDQLAGLPTATKYPCGARHNPTKGVVPHDGTTTMLKPPWGVLTGRMQGLNHRNVPPSMRRSASSPTFTGAGAAMVESPTKAAAPVKIMTESPSGGALNVGGAPSPNEGIRRTVTSANQEAKQGRMPSEAEVLAEQMRGLDGMEGAAMR